jgi:hypothetical protein
MSIIPSLDCEHYHLPPSQDDKCRVPRSGGSWTTAKPRPSRLDGKWSAAAGCLEHLPKVVKVFGQEFPAAFQQRDREAERAAGNQSANILGHKSGQPHGRRRDAFHFPALRQKIGTSKFTQYLYNKNRLRQNHCYISILI